MLEESDEELAAGGAMGRASILPDILMDDQAYAGKRSSRKRAFESDDEEPEGPSEGEEEEEEPSESDLEEYHSPEASDSEDEARQEQALRERLAPGLSQGTNEWLACMSRRGAALEAGNGGAPPRGGRRVCGKGCRTRGRDLAHAPDRGRTTPVEPR